MKIEIWQLIAGTIGTLFGGGVLGQYVKSKNEKKRGEIEILVGGLEKMILALEKRIEILEKENKELRDKIDLKDREVNILQSTIIALNDSWDAFPLPVWFKDSKGRMRYFNTRYAEVFILPQNKDPHDYYGKTDSEFWGLDTGIEFHSNDMEPLRLKKVWRGIENIPMPAGVEKWDILKYVEEKSGVLVGFRGIALEKIEN